MFAGLVLIDLEEFSNVRQCSRQSDVRRHVHSLARGPRTDVMEFNSLLYACNVQFKTISAQREMSSQSLIHDKVNT